VQAILDLSDPVPTSAITGTAHQIGLVSGAVFPIWAMLTLPTNSGSRRAQVRFWLDAATVMVGAAVFAWYFSISPSVSSDDAGSLAGSLLTVGVELVAAFAVVKLLLTGAAGFVREAAIAGAVGAALQGVADGITPGMIDSPWLPLLVAAQMLPAAMVVASPRIQELRVRANPDLLTPAPKRPYSLLPYVAVAATLALLVGVIATGGIEPRVWGVLVGVVVSTGLVIIRQLAAFSENSRLLEELDASLRELRRHEQLLRHQASHDHLTQLANRALFTERTHAAMTGERTTDQMAIVLIDLDDFKPINDNLGHHVGDAVLVAVADKLRGAMRPGDTVARLGGDEFAVLLPSATDADAVGVVDRITTVLAEPVHVDGHELWVCASIGLAAGMPGDPETLLRDADRAMYAAKREHKSAASIPPR
jgi:diguanylate cyclase (GGDEF)-like protein